MWLSLSLMELEQRALLILAIVVFSLRFSSSSVGVLIKRILRTWVFGWTRLWDLDTTFFWCFLGDFVLKNLKLGVKLPDKLLLLLLLTRKADLLMDFLLMLDLVLDLTVLVAAASTLELRFSLWCLILLTGVKAVSLLSLTWVFERWWPLLLVTGILLLHSGFTLDNGWNTRRLFPKTEEEWEN